MPFFFRRSSPGRICGTNRCLDPAAPSIPLPLHRFNKPFRKRIFVLAEQFRPFAKTVRTFPARYAFRKCHLPAPPPHRGSRRAQDRADTGWSLAAMQAYQWAVQYPDIVETILPYCGAARCSPINYAFLDGAKAALQADAAWREGEYATPPEKGLRAFARVYASWAYSPQFFRDGLYRHLGFATLEDFVRDWEEDHLKWHANDLIAKIWTWQHGDISDNPIYRGDFDRALQSIRARAIVMPSSTDMYFVPQENASEVENMPRAELRVFDTAWGHCVGSPGRVLEFQRALDEAAAELLRG